MAKASRQHDQSTEGVAPWHDGGGLGFVTYREFTLSVDWNDATAG